MTHISAQMQPVIQELTHKAFLPSVAPATATKIQGSDFAKMVEYQQEKMGLKDRACKSLEALSCRIHKSGFIRAIETLKCPVIKVISIASHVSKLRKNKKGIIQELPSSWQPVMEAFALPRVGTFTGSFFSLFVLKTILSKFVMHVNAVYTSDDRAGATLKVMRDLGDISWIISGMEEILKLLQVVDTASNVFVPLKYVYLPSHLVKIALNAKKIVKLQRLKSSLSKDNLQMGIAQDQLRRIEEVKELAFAQNGVAASRCLKQTVGIIKNRLTFNQWSKGAESVAFLVGIVAFVVFTVSPFAPLGTIFALSAAVISLGIYIANLAAKRYYDQKVEQQVCVIKRIAGEWFPELNSSGLIL